MLGYTCKDCKDCKSSQIPTKFMTVGSSSLLVPLRENTHTQSKAQAATYNAKFLRRYVSTRDDTRSILRIDQLDALNLQSALLRVLYTQLSQIFLLFPQGNSVSHLFTHYISELRSILHALLLFVALPQVYGDRLHNLFYGTYFTWKLKAAYISLEVLLPYAIQKTSAQVFEANWDPDPSVSCFSSRRVFISRILNFGEIAAQSFSLVNTILFLWMGKYRNLTDRVLGLPLRYGSQRMIKILYAPFVLRALSWRILSSFLHTTGPWLRPIFLGLLRGPQCLIQYTQVFFHSVTQIISVSLRILVLYLKPIMERSPTFGPGSNFNSFRRFLFERFLSLTPSITRQSNSINMETGGAKTLSNPLSNPDDGTEIRHSLLSSLSSCGICCACPILISVHCMPCRHSFCYYCIARILPLRCETSETSQESSKRRPSLTPGGTNLIYLNADDERPMCPKCDHSVSHLIRG